jgi:hypothetical protein
VTRKSRNLLFAFVVAFFLIAAPLLILYARGYSLNTEERRVVRTGMILIDTNLPRVLAALNGQPAESEDDPVLLRGLEEGQYSVRLEREGYTSWEATIPVAQEQVTRIEHVLMLFTEPEREVPIIGPVGKMTLSGNGRYLAYSISSGSDQGLWLHTNGEEENRQLLDSDELDVTSLDLLAWSENSRMLVGRTSQGYFLIAPHVTNPAQTKLTFLKGLPQEDVALDRDEPSTVYYRDSKERLFRWKTAQSGTSPELLTSDVLAFSVVNPKLFVLQSNQKGSQLQSIDLREEQPSLTFVAQLPSAAQRIVTSSSANVAVLDADQALWLLQRQSDGFEFVQIGAKVEQALWSTDGRYLAYLRESEIWAHDQDPLQDQPPQFLVTRYQDSPEDVSWHPDDNHLVLQQRNDKTTSVSLVHVSRVVPGEQNLPDIATNTQQQLWWGRRGTELWFIEPLNDKPAVNVLTVTSGRAE